MEICIDFDGTCVTHEFPKVGKDIGAVPVLKKLIQAGHVLILFTMRSNCNGNTGASEEFPNIIDGNFLDDAVRWFCENDIPLYGININPKQKSWTTSPKAYGQLYIDDAALGCPLKQDYKEFDPPVFNLMPEGRPYVDWSSVEKWLYSNNII